MNALLRAIWVVARRDYVATVWSRTFLFFLIFPLLVPVFSIGMGLMAAHETDEPGPPPTAMVRVTLDQPSYEALIDARTRLAKRLGGDELPEFARDTAPDAPVLSGTLEHPRLGAPRSHIRELAGDVGLVIDDARDHLALGGKAPDPVHLALQPRAAQPQKSDKGRIAIAHGGQFVLFFLIMMLAGMMISNLVEEKSNKVIELLLAAIPIDAVFAGKLVGMLGVSLTGVLLWGSAAAIGAWAFVPAGLLPPPAVGWPAFVAFGFIYYVMAFSLLGGLYLGIGAQAASVREVQTLSLPLTLGQVVVLGLASASIGHPDSPLALVADVIPWSSPYAMLARAAVDGRLWPHLPALAWQALAVAVTIRVGASLFRTNILKSGGGRSKL